ncbi:MAG: hypothetical protein ABJB86_13710, partial [Bacteroidota bacterium]
IFLFFAVFACPTSAFRRARSLPELGFFGVMEWEASSFFSCLCVEDAASAASPKRSVKLSELGLADFRILILLFFAVFA